MQPCENAEVKTTGGVEYLMCKIDGTPCHVLNIPEWCAKKERNQECTSTALSI